MILFGQAGGMDFDEKTAYRYIYIIYTENMLFSLL